MSCKLSSKKTICMTCLLRRQFAWNVEAYFLKKKKKKKNLVNLPFDELAQRVVMVNLLNVFGNSINFQLSADDIWK